MKKYSFPKDFMWGTASSSYQIEGAVGEGGRSESIWDRYCSVPGNVAKGETGAIACDHYHRYKEDIALMKEMGLKAYRFSIAWPRVIPTGYGAVNEEGLQFYSDLVDELIKNGIEPYPTLYHWDLPQCMQDIGGWANADMPGYFLSYAKAVFHKLDGRVKSWMTLNEPYCAAFLGHYEGRQAPGIRDFSTAVRVAHHQYVAHGLTVEYFRQAQIGGKIGIALNMMGRLPLTDSPEDVAAAKRADGYLNRWFADPILKGCYPPDMLDWYRSQGVVLPEIKAEDMARISQPLDFIGLNYYNDFYVRHAPEVWPLQFKIENPHFVPVNSRNWPITESGFSSMLLRLKDEYGVKEILITENGTSTNETIALDGRVRDTDRIDYLKRHIREMHGAMEQGVNITGYLQWSFSDNFEWSFGYSSRFGLVYVDFETQQRTVKDSGHWYGDLAKSGEVEI